MHIPITYSTLTHTPKHTYNTKSHTTHTHQTHTHTHRHTHNTPQTPHTPHTNEPTHTKHKISNHKHRHQTHKHTHTPTHTQHATNLKKCVGNQTHVIGSEVGLKNWQNPADDAKILETEEHMVKLIQFLHWPKLKPVRTWDQEYHYTY